MRQGNIFYYTSGRPSQTMTLQKNDYYELTVVLEEYRKEEYRLRLTKTTDGTSSYQEHFLTKEELIKLRNHIDNVIR